MKTDFIFKGVQEQPAYLRSLWELCSCLGGWSGSPAPLCDHSCHLCGCRSWHRSPCQHWKSWALCPWRPVRRPGLPCPTCPVPQGHSPDPCCSGWLTLGPLSPDRPGPTCRPDPQVLQPLERPCPGPALQLQSSVLPLAIPSRPSTVLPQDRQGLQVLHQLNGKKKKKKKKKKIFKISYKFKCTISNHPYFARCVNNRKSSKH
jgi:hypothetical protein